MAGVAINLEAHGGEKRIGELASIVKEALTARGDAELVYESARQMGDAAVHLLALERFYLRNGSYAAMSLMLTEEGEDQTAVVVASGGGEGIFNFSLGANESFANMAAELLLPYGFREVERV